MKQVYKINLNWTADPIPFLLLICSILSYFCWILRSKFKFQFRWLTGIKTASILNIFTLDVKDCANSSFGQLSKQAMSQYYFI